MSKFADLIEKILQEKQQNLNEKIDITPLPRTYEELLHIFCLDTAIKENIDDIQTNVSKARELYHLIINKIKNKEYITEDDKKIIYLNDLTIIIDENTDYNKAYYNNEYKTISLYTDNINEIQGDALFRANLIHELTHYLTQDKFNKDTYIQPEEDITKYYTQPNELDAYTSSIADLIIKSVKQEIRYHTTTKSIFNNKELIQKRLDSKKEKSVKQNFFIYKGFLETLQKDKEKFQNFYTEIIEACLQYINKNLNECITSSELNLWLAHPLK